jgi:hypothetical protein
LYGGIGENDVYGSLHIFDLVTEEWLDPEYTSETRPPPLESHSALYYPGDERGFGRKIVIFGGNKENLTDSVKRSNEVYYLDLRPDGNDWCKGLQKKG